ncbi:MBL fold metallo-hydrolase [Pendulispora rubella]|uniref:MBL fold metallo-hydrolase n=1 Tax=Pendulispora rubella TaxID=2741070 RepID=A0ABZ2KUD1_9BACT
MRVHHLNCGSMRMPGAPLVCHVLLLETHHGLALVDTGFGSADIADPGGRIGSYRHVTRPRLDPEETAIAQVRGRGFDPADVRDIVLTHFDADHVGGLSDFPWARVHTTADEWTAASQRGSQLERARYRPAQWTHGPKLVPHGAGGDTWRGFPSATCLTEIDDGVVLIPLPGHTRGHAAVAIDAGHRWIFHAGDAFYDQSIVTGIGREPLILTVQEWFVAHDWARVRRNHERLAELHRSDPEVMLVSAHDPSLLERARATSVPRNSPLPC